MAGCDAHNLGGDEDAGVKRVTAWAVAGAIAGAAATFGVALTVSWLVVMAAVFGAIAGAGLGFFVGSAADWFSRLKTQNPEKITMIGNAMCHGRNPFGLQPWTDGDWTVNLGNLAFLTPIDLPITVPDAGNNRVQEIRLRAAPGSGLAQAFPSFNEDAHTTPILHCELGAHQGAYSVVGGAVGSVAGAGAGAAAGLAACAGAGVFGFIGVAVCLLVAAALAALGAWAGGAAGDAVGAFAGWVVDELSDFDKKGKTLEAGSGPGCVLLLGGTWVTDTSHQHNEIHDIEFIQIMCEDPRGANPPATDTHRDNFVATVAIGRKPPDEGTPIK
jgi:MFS family permease